MPRTVEDGDGAEKMDGAGCKRRRVEATPPADEVMVALDALLEALDENIELAH